MQPHQPTPPNSPGSDPSIKKNIDSAAVLKDAEKRLAEAEKRFNARVEPYIPPLAADKAAETPPAETAEHAEPSIGSAATPKSVEARIAELEADLEANAREAETHIKEAEARATEQRDAWLRAKAETENVRRRAQEEIAKASKFAAERFAGAMLPIKDSLEAALAAQGQTQEALREGVELTLKQLVAAFEGVSLFEENPLGQKFDPNKHQAISTVESDTDPNTVVHVLQKGYLLHERVIRPAMVIVSKAKPAAEA